MSAPLTIAELNDAFRASFTGGRVLVTPGISALSEFEQCMILGAVHRFDSFSPDNDPHGERDFGAFDRPGVGRIFWKIDYYDPSMEQGSEDPADPTKTVRVLTIMLASEY
ncbi:hypothetical protein AU375_00267 [Methylobacterium radiotolerans]|nr:hypothetical protein AU375_00267 [Methylobacterium radiotolerans]